MNIVYVSNTGLTAAYAELLGRETGLKVYSLAQAKGSLDTGAPVIFLGWLMAGKVMGYRKAAKRYQISAVCGVGLGDTGSQVETVRSSNSIPAQTPLFTLQGGMDYTRLRGVYKSMIRVLTKSMSSKKDRSPDEERMLELLLQGGNFVSIDNLHAVLEWYRK